jgi:anhydro-N-acetylmuramic acid kinase
MEFDQDGQIASSGILDSDWYDELNQIDFWRIPPPRSISNQWVNETIISKIPQKKPADLLHTFIHFLSDLIVGEMRKYHISSVLITGGGAFNKYLIETIQSKSKDVVITVPEESIVNGKEAIIFALMAVLRLRDKKNVLSSVTGADKDTIAGTIFHP